MANNPKGKDSARDGQPILARIVAEVAKHATDEEVETLGKAVHQFLFHRLPDLLSAGLIPESGAVLDTTALAAMMGMTPDGVRKWADSRGVRRGKIGKRHAYLGRDILTAFLAGHTNDDTEAGDEKETGKG